RVVMGEELRAVVAPARELLDPGRGLLVSRRALAARELPVCDLLREGMRKREFDFPCDRGAPVATQELRALELVERFLRLPLRALPQRAHATQPARPPEYGRFRDESLLGGRERVEAGRDDAVHAFRQPRRRACQVPA